MSSILEFAFGWGTNTRVVRERKNVQIRLVYVDGQKKEKILKYIKVKHVDA